MKKAQIEREPRFGDATAFFVFAICALIALIFGVIFCHGVSPLFFANTVNGIIMTFFSFSVGIGVNLLGKVKEPTLSRLSLVIASIGCTGFFYGVAEFLLSTYLAFPMSLFYHRIFASVHIIVTCFDTFIFGGRWFSGNKSKVTIYVVLLIISLVLSVVLYGIAGMIFINPNGPSDIALGIISGYLPWVAAWMFFVWKPLADVFGEVRALMKMSLITRGIVYLILCLLFGALCCGIGVGLTFVENAKMDMSSLTAIPIGLRVMFGGVTAWYSYTPALLITHYTDNLLKEHPLVPVDLSEKRSGRKGMVKNQKQSQKGTRCLKRMGMIFSFVVVGYICYHGILGGLNMCGYGVPYYIAGDEAMSLMIAVILFIHAHITQCYGLSVIVDPNAPEGSKTPQEDKSKTNGNEGMTQISSIHSQPPKETNVQQNNASGWSLGGETVMRGNGAGTTSEILQPNDATSVITPPSSAMTTYSQGMLTPSLGYPNQSGTQLMVGSAMSGFNSQYSSDPSTMMGGGAGMFFPSMNYQIGSPSPQPPS
ncbi:uncharacterized protein MONOS_16225 [Monocercomonoides exilis]|uniref:uncharacterized protein n=1 Tax=Monocercomonoides exilis TaxID=2049356 RepID=UPI0035594D24|nr:hypothetical protein MONOS_16225 [Monocercomonoides exilis]|eukprot:MONOS_16225.1-p1 / transcript=MONOS_16225.1 / gene=MONOS_16225 / organism=Monocercomonoides_exilis_PA203 / gene_product=unspecified product / transcript_product=unspecified product / location=Mono_scaffold01574:1938-3765(-) / protein_length=537 / sequence_SO=supercontig / SO=protein_coding / is_pseudo=false